MTTLSCCFDLLSHPRFVSHPYFLVTESNLAILVDKCFSELLINIDIQRFLWKIVNRRTPYLSKKPSIYFLTNLTTPPSQPQQALWPENHPTVIYGAVAAEQ